MIKYETNILIDFKLLSFSQIFQNNHSINWSIRMLLYWTEKLELFEDSNLVEEEV